MTFHVAEARTEAPHRWTALQGQSDPSAAADPLVVAVADELRRAYGEEHLRGRLHELTSDPAVANRFDLDAVMRGFRAGLPDPAAEASKPASLRNYRSETGEMVARLALAQHEGVRFPAAGQLGKGNANQPVFGFDGWGVQADALVLVQVKATDDVSRPPAESANLHAECRRAPTEQGKIARTLGAMAVQATDQAILPTLFALLESIGRGLAPKLRVAPVLVRGQVPAHMDDLRDLRASPPAPEVLGLSVGVGAPLEPFGRAVANLARSA